MEKPLSRLHESLRQIRRTATNQMRIPTPASQKQKAGVFFCRAFRLRFIGRGKFSVQNISVSIILYDMVTSCPAFQDGRMIVRGHKHLICIGNK